MYKLDGAHDEPKNPWREHFGTLPLCGHAMMVGNTCHVGKYEETTRFNSMKNSREENESLTNQRTVRRLFLLLSNYSM